jgi:hypothetical protein
VALPNGIHSRLPICAVAQWILNPAANRVAAENIMNMWETPDARRNRPARRITSGIGIYIGPCDAAACATFRHRELAKVDV